MRRLAVWLMALGLAMTPVAAGAASGNEKDAAATKKEDAKSEAAKKGSETAKGEQPKANSELDLEIQQLKDLIQAQSQELEKQREALREQQARTEELMKQMATMRLTAGQPGVPAEVAATKPGGVIATSGGAPGTGVTSVVTGTSNAKSAQDEKEPESPLQFRIGSAYITPVGFMDFTTVWRNHDGGSGIGTNFAGIPYGNVFANNLSEFRFSMQNSRIGFRVDATVKGAHVIGYMESDFLGNNPGNVAVSSNSNTLRSRLYWVDVRKGQFEILGGQTWSLITPGRTGISPLPADIFYTNNIDVNYQLGLVWGRIPEARFVWHRSDKFAIAAALDSPEQYNGGSAGGPLITCPASLNTICTSEFNNGGNTLGVANRAPDIIAKAAFDPSKRAHIEFGGVERQFHDWNPNTLAKFSKTGGGGFLNMNFEVFKGFRLLSNNFWSDGGGRYIFGQAPDAIIRADGSISPVHASSTVTGFEYTRGNSLFYGYYGAMYVSRNLAFDANGTTPIGYGNTNAASGQNRNVQEITLGFNQTLFKDGKYGALTFMTQYSYLSRNPWFIVTGQPEDAHLSMVFLNLRYLLPGSAPTLGK